MKTPSSEEPFTHHDGVAWQHEVGQLHFDFLLLAVDDADDLDTARGAAVADSAPERQRLKHAGVLLLEAVRARVLNLAEHVDTLRARHEHPVAVLECGV